MNKNIFAYLVLLLLFTGCNDYNDNFDGLDDLSRPKNVIQLEYTLEDSDYTLISSNSTNKALAGKEDSVALVQLRNNKFFNSTITAEKYLPAFALAKWYTADDGSAVKITYNQVKDLPGYVEGIEKAAGYTVSSSDYQTVWGSVNADYFTPVKAVSANLPKILGNAVSEADNGDYLLVSYRYSDREPGESSELILTEMNEDFETVTSNSAIALEGWSNVGPVGNKKWEGRVYSNNYYAQISQVNGEDTDSWLVTPKFDLSAATSPKLSFDVTTGYNTGATLKVLVSEDFNGSDPTTATWTDVSANFYIPTLPASGYGVLSPAGIMDLSGYQSSPFFIAFRYSCPAGKQATYQIDNVQVGDVNTVVKTNIVFEDFETLDTEVSKTPVDLPGWSNIGTVKWHGYRYGGSSFPEITAYNMGEVDTYLVSPEILIEAGSLFTFDVNPRYYAGECLSVLVSEDFAGDAEAATWDDITGQFAIPTAQTSDFVTAGVASLDDYKGKSVSIAFRYTGSQSAGTTTTIRIDNFNVYTLSRVNARMARATTASYVGTVVDRFALYQYNGSAWNEVENTIVINPEDYKEMGAPGTNNNFSSSINPDNYLPVFLTLKYPYVQEEEMKTVVYHYYNNGLTLRVEDYEYTDGSWSKMRLGIEPLTAQFVRANGKWQYDPSVVLNLPPSSNNPETAPYFRAIVDYVAETYGTKYYQSGYDNAEYYYGSSSYQSNFDFRLSAWRNSHQAVSDYADMSDAELEKLQYERLLEAFIPMLKVYYGDMNVIDGMDTTITINFGLYVGDRISAPTHTIVYLVVGKGEFEYVEDSFQKL